MLNSYDFYRNLICANGIFGWYKTMFDYQIKKIEKHLKIK